MNVAPVEVVLADRSVTNLAGEGCGTASDLLERLAVGVEDRRDDKRALGCDGDADVDGAVKREPIAGEACVQLSGLAAGRLRRP